MSTARGLALAVLVVIIATAPLWLRAVNRMLRGRRSTVESPVMVPHPGLLQTPPSSDIPSARGIERAAPAPPPIGASQSKPHPAWDEGDWGLPEAGLEPGDSRGAVPPSTGK